MQSGQELLKQAATKRPALNRPIVDWDNRAENNQRTVHFEEERIVIMRRIHGVSMRVTMPVNKYDGIGVLLPNIAEGRDGFSVVLAHADTDLLSMRLLSSGRTSSTFRSWTAARTVISRCVTHRPRALLSVP